ncbi:MAG TPA: DEAD/DEAH box helicase, partial [Micavibrio sp.]
DRMLDMGFIPDIEKIVSKVPPMRQTLLFSATMPPEIKKLADKFLSNPKTVSVAPPASPAETVRQSILWVKDREKRAALDALIQMEDVKNAFIFCNRKTEVDALAKWLASRNYSVAAMHGDMVQSARTKTLQDFKSGDVMLMVCSDVAARGIDIAGMSHVFNYDVPMHADDYVHRIGRTGRAGQQGRAWMLASPDDDKFVKGIEALIKKSIPVEKLENFETPSMEDDESSGRGEEGRRPQRGDRDRRPLRQGSDRSRPERQRNDRPNPDQPRNDQPRSEMSKRGNRPATRRDGSRPAERAPQPRYKDDDTSPSGFGDDLPAFLKR